MATLAESGDLRKVSHRIGFVPGDGIGPEVAWAARRCADATGIEIKWENFPLGQGLFARTGDPMPQTSVSHLLKIGKILKAPLDSGYDGALRNPNSILKDLFGVFASVRRCQSFKGVSAPWEGLDVLIVRQEGWGASVMEVEAQDPAWEFLAHLHDGEASAAKLCFVSQERTRQYFEFAFALATRTGRKKVTVAHKANIFKKTDGLWLKSAEEVSRRFPGLEFEDQLIDHVVLQLARSPRRFEVVLVNELYGDLVGDLGVGLAGGLGIVPQVFYGTKGSIFTSVHGTAPKYAGMDRANPCAMILSVAAMLTELGEWQAARNIEEAICAVLRSGTRTADLCLSSESNVAISTKEFVNSVIKHIHLGRGSEREKGPFHLTK